MERGQAQRQQQVRRQQSRSRKRKKYTLHYLLLFLFCIGLGLTLCFTVLFKINTIQVENNSYYSSEELISRSGLSKGESLFAFNAGDIEKMLEDRFPYIQSVKVKRRLPTTIILSVTEEVPLGSAYTEEGYSILSESGKVLKVKVNEAPKELPVLLGLEDESFTVGSYLSEVAEAKDGSKSRVLTEKFQRLQRFMTIAEEAAFGNLTYIELTDLGEIKVLYDGRILIDFGSELDLSKKIAFVQKVLEDGIADKHPLSGYTNENFEGTIDITDRKQLRTRALAISTVADQRAFTVFEDEDAFFAEEDEEEPVTEEPEVTEEEAEQEE
ncbi:MAG: FtsQ-type POTRA domain-containing protein [Oscillospiraceae bacterium]|nr:FtsQ-type POTRA domain-containing protein [Oscillospiraceae bacterium]